MDFSPKIPVGMNIKTNISKTKVKASLKVVQPKPFMMFSQMPITKAPITAPGIEPIPPKTAATKALRPGIAPTVGVTPV